MSHNGKMFRGERLHDMRNRDGDYPPGVLNNPAKMEDINYFLKNSKKEEPKEEPKSQEKKVK